MKYRPGFTILELLVAMTVSIVLVAMMLSLATGIASRFNGMQERLQTQAVARFALDRIARDLEEMVALPSPSEWLALRTGATSYGGLPADELMFYTAEENATTAGNGGGVSAVYYGLQYQGLAAKTEQPLYALYRAAIDGEQTFDKAAGSVALATLWDDGGEFNHESTARANLLAENVIGVHVTLHFRRLNGTFESLQAPLRLGDHWTGQWASVVGPARRLVSAEVRLTLLSKQGAKMLQTALPSNEVIKRYGFTFSRTVSVRAQPELWIAIPN